MEGKLKFLVHGRKEGNKFVLEEITNYILKNLESYANIFFYILLIGHINIVNNLSLSSNINILLPFVVDILRSLVVKQQYPL